MKSLYARVMPLGNHIHHVGNHIHTHRKKYLASHITIAMLFTVLSILGGSTHPNKASAASGDLAAIGSNIDSNATGVSIATQVFFAFNQTPTESTVIVDGNSDGKPDHVQLTPAGGSAIAGTMSHFYDGQMGAEIYQFTPGSSLSPGTVYTLTLSGGSSGITANAGADYMATDYSLSFTTAAPDVTPPTISSGTVTNGIGATLSLTTSAPYAEAVNYLAPNININFSEHVTESTIAADTSPADNVPDNAYVSYIDTTGTVIKVPGSWFFMDSGTNNYMRFNLAGGESFKTNREYTITLTTAITDTSDTPNHMAENYVAKFLTTGTYAIVYPTFTSMPANLAVGQPACLCEFPLTSGFIEVYFNQPIKPTSVTGNILVYNQSGEAVAGTITMNGSDGSAVRFTPSLGNLLEDNTYQVKLVGGNSGIKNVNNVPYASATSENAYWTFHTTNGYPIDFIPPAVNIAGSNINSSGMTGVATTVGSITVPFTETNPMDASTINTASIYLTAPGPVPVDGTTISYNYATKTATLGNIPTLSAGTIYTITVTSMVTDVSLNSVFLPSWTFTTASAAVTVPVATMTTPTDGAMSVSTGTSIVVEFDQAVNSSLASPSQIALSKSVNGSNPVYVNIAMSAGDTIATLTPGSSLDPGTEYFVVFVDISPASTPGENALNTGYKHFTTAGDNNNNNNNNQSSDSADLSALMTDGVATISDGGTLEVSGDGAGSSVALPTGLAMGATGWNGTVAVTYSTSVPTGFTSGKVVSVAFGGVSGQPVKLSSAVLVTIPLAGFNPSTYIAEITASDGIEYVVSQCTTQYNDGGKSVATNYTLGNYLTGAASAQHCYTYDDNNVYFATNHFSDFAAGPAEVVGPVAPTPAGGGIVISHSDQDTTKAAPPVEEVLVPAFESAPVPSSANIQDFKDLTKMDTMSWQYPIAKQMIEAGLMKGYFNRKGDLVWNVNGTMTRAEAAVLIARYTGFDDTKKVKKAPFRDVSIGMWYASSVAHLKSMGVISGMTTSTFNPGIGVSNAEFFKMAVNAHIKLHPDVEIDWNTIMNSSSSAFTDVQKSDWFYPYMNLAEAKKLLPIYNINSKNVVEPNKDIHRIDAAKIINKFIKLKSQNISRIGAAELLIGLKEAK